METSKEIEVYESEWADNGKALWLNGIEGDVYYREADEYDEAAWVARIQPTSSRCEWPELIDCAWFETEAEATAFAERVIRKADEKYPHISYT